jgi:hypothetical protein
MNYYLPICPDKTHTPTMRLIDLLFEAKKLGLDKVNIDDLIRNLKSLSELEENLMKSCFMEGRDFQSDEENKFISYADSAEEHFKENYIRYI